MGTAHFYRKARLNSMMKFLAQIYIARFRSDGKKGKFTSQIYIHEIFVDLITLADKSRAEFNTFSEIVLEVDLALKRIEVERPLPDLPFCDSRRRLSQGSS
jgi:hypothetical protein